MTHYRLQPGCALQLTTDDPAVAMAARDVADDLHRVLGRPSEVRCDGPAAIRVGITPGGEPEQWTIRVSPDGIDIVGADTLGAIYALYAISQRHLGVDPLWFWKDLAPEARSHVDVPLGEHRSTPAAFRFRGWFLNDEDLLTEWHDGCKPRVLDYPFYQQVTHPAVMARVYEALLRSGGNLIIPASFVNIMEDSERPLVADAVKRGLYVTQHHIEPLGVSHFTFERYWSQRGERCEFSYGSEPDRVREVWRHSARAWAQTCGNRVVWQLGLRGRGDRPVWHHDKSVTADQAGAFISRALAEQWAIVREVDGRDEPPATLTLWDEGSQLMAAGQLQLPPGVCAVFCDRGASQTMQQDFYDVAREPGRRYGVYYHLAYWGSGPHLAQGVSPSKIERVFDEIMGKGDTHYAIVNTANIREMTLGISALMQLWQRGRDWRADRFLDEALPATLVPLYTRFFGSILNLRMGEHRGVIVTQDLHPRTLSDGEARQLVRLLIEMHTTGPARPLAEHRLVEGCEAMVEMCVPLRLSADALDTVADDAEAAQSALPPRWHAFVAANLIVQARILSGLYRCAASLIDAFDRPAAFEHACEALDRVLVRREAAAAGRWTHWCRGDRKMNLPKLLDSLRPLAASTTNDKEPPCTR